MSLSDGATSGFQIITSSEGSGAVLTLHGSVVSGAVLELSGAMEAAIDRRPASVVLDLSGLEFIGAAGLVAVANAEIRASGFGITLTVRSRSELLNHLLAAIGDEEDRGLGAEQITEASIVAPGLAGTSGDLRRMTALAAHPDVIDGALRLVVELALSAVKGADGVSVSLLRHGFISTVAASDQTIMDMDAEQYAANEGPCLDASLRGHWFHAESLANETRWPAFTPQALALGINAILSSPLTASAAPVGALNIYSRTASAFDFGAQETAAVFARKASAILSDAGAGVSDDQMASRYNEALRSREIIALAKGMIMEREGIDEARAFKTLLRLSLHSGEPLRSRAESTVLSARRPTPGPE